MPVDGLRAYKRRPLTGEEKKRFDENWDAIFGKSKDKTYEIRRQEEIKPRQ